MASQPARQSTSQSVGAIDQQIVLADSWLLAVPASVGVVRFGSTWTRRSTLNARLPMRLAAAVFDTIYTKCRSFWRFAFVADSIVPRGPWPVARSRCVPGRALHRTVARPYYCHKTTTSGCTLLQQN